MPRASYRLRLSTSSDATTVADDGGFCLLGFHYRRLLGHFWRHEPPPARPTTLITSPCRDLLFETSPILRHGHDPRWQLALPRRCFHHFPTIVRLNNADHHPRWLSLTKAKLLRPLSTMLFPTAISPTFRPFSSQPTAEICWLSPASPSPLPGPLIGTSGDPWIPAVTVFW